MPIPPPSRTRAEVVRAQKREPIATLDCFGIWLLSVALCAVGLAGLVYFADSDNVGASLVLVCAASIIAVMLRVCNEPEGEERA